uniref:Uncharacterized protein n=1 Tax=Anopheles merus TaxID=30066 RepID=A0A182V771_ANOME
MLPRDPTIDEPLPARAIVFSADSLIDGRRLPLSLLPPAPTSPPLPLCCLRSSLPPPPLPPALSGPLVPPPPPPPPPPYWLISTLDAFSCDMHDTDHGRSVADRCGLRFTTVDTLPAPPLPCTADVESEGLELAAVTPPAPPAPPVAVAAAVPLLPPFELVATPSSSFEFSDGQVATELASPSELSVSRAIESESVYSPDASQSVVGAEAGSSGADTEEDAEGDDVPGEDDSSDLVRSLESLFSSESVSRCLK